MKKTITIEETIAFLNLCAVANPRETTELMNNVKIANAVKSLFHEDSDRICRIRIMRTTTGNVIGFIETEKPKAEKPRISKPKNDKKKKGK